MTIEHVKSESNNSLIDQMNQSITYLVQFTISSLLFFWGTWRHPRPLRTRMSFDWARCWAWVTVVFIPLVWAAAACAQLAGLDWAELALFGPLWLALSWLGFVELAFG